MSEAFVRTGRPLADLEAEMLNGQKLQVGLFFVVQLLCNMKLFFTNIGS